MIVGRDPEQAAIGDAVDAVVQGTGALVVVTGARGVGKSSLVDAALAERSEVHIVRITCTPTEADVAWAGLSSLVVDLRTHLDAVADRPRQLLTGLVGWGPGVHGDPVAAGMAGLALLIAAAEHAPLVVVIDDAHLLDAESRAVLEFVARRVTGLAVGLIVISSGDEPGFAPHARVVPLGDLDRRSARTLLRQRGLADPVAAEIVADCGTSPQMLVTIAERLEPDQRSGAIPLSSPLPGISTDDADAAADARIATHQHLALALADVDPVRSRWHRALATEGPDADLAAELERAALQAGAAGQPVDAYRLASEAARISPPADARRRRLAAIDAAIQARLTDAAATLLDHLDRTGPDSQLRAARLLEATGDLHGARHAFLALVDDPTVDQAVREAARLDAAALCLRTYDLYTVDRLTQPLERPADPSRTTGDGATSHDTGGVESGGDDPELTRRLSMLRTAAYASIGVTTAIDAVVDHARHALELTLAPHELVELAESFAITLARAGRRPELFRLADVLQRRATDAGVPAVAPALLIARAAYLGRSDLVGALDAANEAVALIEELRHYEYLAQALTHQGNALAGLGDATALDIAERIEAYRGPLAEGAAMVVRCAYHRTVGDDAGLLASVEATHWRIGRKPELSVLWHLDLFEAALEVGRTDLVTDIRETLVELDSVFGSSWVRAGLDRIDGLLTDDLATAVEHWQRSATTFAERGYEINAARTELVWATRLLADGDRAGAATVARRARVRFAVAGMGRWIARCDEITARAASSTPTTGTPTVGPSSADDGTPDLTGAANQVLTPRELQVARWLVEGATYRQIADQLFVSARTVESHCGAIYRKLGVRGRSGLAARALNDRTLQLLPDTA